MRDPFFAFDAMSISTSSGEWSSRDSAVSSPAVKMRPSVEGLAESGLAHARVEETVYVAVYGVYGVVRCALSMAPSGSYGFLIYRSVGDGSVLL